MNPISIHVSSGCARPFPWQITTIIVADYQVPFPPIMDMVKRAFSWANLSLFELVETGCKASVCVHGAAPKEYGAAACER